MAELPPPNTKRWLVYHKAAVVGAVHNEEITLEEACRRYQIAKKEFLAWQRAFEGVSVSTLTAVGAPVTRRAFNTREPLSILRDVASALCRLPKKQRFAGLLVGVEGRCHEEVAKMTGRSLAGIRHDLVLARQCLRTAARVVEDDREIASIGRAEHRIAEEIKRIYHAESAVATLPPPNIKRWTPRRKAAVVIAVQSGQITLHEAYRRYQLSEEEFLDWECRFDADTLLGLRATGFRNRRNRNC
jgi:hypothetical protein